MRGLTCTALLITLFCSVDPPLSKKQHVSLYDYDIATDDEVEESQPVKKKMKKGGEMKGEKKKSRNEQESRS